MLHGGSRRPVRRPRNGRGAERPGLRIGPSGHRAGRLPPPAGRLGTWTLFKETTGNSGGNHVDTTLATGTTDTSGAAWHRLRLTFRGGTITPVIDGTPGAAVTDGTYTAGQVGLRIGGYADTQFDDLTVDRLG